MITATAYRLCKWGSHFSNYNGAWSLSVRRGSRRHAVRVKAAGAKFSRTPRVSLRKQIKARVALKTWLRRV